MTAKYDFCICLINFRVNLSQEYYLIYFVTYNRYLMDKLILLEILQILSCANREMPITFIFWEDICNGNRTKHARCSNFHATMIDTKPWM